MNAAVYGVPVSVMINIVVGEEEVINDIVTVWGELHLSRVVVQDPETDRKWRTSK